MSVSRDPLSWAFLAWLVACTAVFELLLPWHLFYDCILRRRSFDQALREHVWWYGRFLIYGVARPVLKVRVHHLERVPKGTVVYVLNHRSAADAFFAACYAAPPTIFQVRSWPFSIPTYGWFMRRLGYIDVESRSFEEFAEGEGRRAVERGLSMIVFPEGHRSRNGLMQRFHSGAFEFAARHGLPIVPVCLQGTERLLPVVDVKLRPATVDITVLEPVPSLGKQGAQAVLALRRQVQRQMREFLGEPVLEAKEPTHA